MSSNLSVPSTPYEINVDEALLPAVSSQDTEQATELATDVLEQSTDLDELSAKIPPVEVFDPTSAGQVVNNTESEVEPALVTDPAPDMPVEGPVFVPYNTTAKKRISNMLIQIVSAMRHEIALGETLENVYATRLKAIDDNDVLDDSSKEAARVIVKQAYETTKTLPAVDPTDKKELGALALLASGLVDPSKVMYDNPTKRKKRVNKPHDAKTIARRKKNKSSKISRRKNRK